MISLRDKARALLAAGGKVQRRHVGYGYYNAYGAEVWRSTLEKLVIGSPEWDMMLAAGAAVPKPIPANEREESTSSSTVRIERDYSQLTPEEQVEMADACGDVRDSVRLMHAESIALARHIDRPSAMLKRERMEMYLRKIQNQAIELQRALMKIPYSVTAGLVLAACLLLPGCGDSRRTDSDAAAVSSVPGSGPATCTNGQCRAK